MRRSIALLMMLSTVFAQTSRQPESPGLTWEPPTIELPSAGSNPTVPKTILTRLTVAGLPIQLEHTLLGDVGKRLGGVSEHEGDAGEAIEWLCFYGQDTKGLWGLWLISGEIDGPMIGGFQWRRLPAKARMDHRCKLLNTSNRPAVELPIALHLGMSPPQVEALLGKPSSRFRDTTIYEHEHGLRLHGELYSAGNTLYLAFKDGALWTILANYTISS